MPDQIAIPATTPPATTLPVTGPTTVATTPAGVKSSAPVVEPVPGDKDLGAKDNWLGNLLAPDSTDEAEAPRAVPLAKPPVPEKPAGETPPPKVEVEVKALAPKPELKPLPAEVKPVEPKVDVPVPIEQSLEERRKAYGAWRADLEGKMAKVYALSDEDAEKMLSKPEEVLPALAARLHMDVYEAVLSELHTQLPQIVNGLMSQTSKVKEHEDRFFGAFPVLKDHKDEVIKFAAVYRQMNPNMKAEEFIDKVGKAVKAMLGVTDAPSAPRVDPTVINREVVQNGGFAPVTGGGYAPAVQQPKNTNPYAEMAKDLLEDLG